MTTNHFASPGPIAPLLACLALLGSLPTWTAHAQTGLLVVAHGAGPEWNSRVRETIGQVQWDSGPVAPAFLMGAEAQSASFGAAMERLLAAGAKAVVVVPLMISSAGSHYRQVRFYARELPALPSELAAHAHYAPPDRWPVPVRVTGALDGSPEMTAILRQRASDLAPADQRRALSFIAHGPSDSAQVATWITDLERAVRPVAGERGVPFSIGLLRDDADPPVRKEAVQRIREDIDRLARETTDSVVVLSLLISQGSLNRIALPADLVGMPIRYQPSSLAPSPFLARWIERMATSAEIELAAAGRP
jgi:sirohydrochlorin ferrochelatase